MRVARPRRPYFWSYKKTRMLLELREAKVPTPIISKQLGATVDAINGRLRTLGAPRRPQFRWTPEADARLVAYYQKPKCERVPLKVELRSWPEGPTPAAIYQRAFQLELTKKHYNCGMLNKIKHRQERVFKKINRKQETIECEYRKDSLESDEHKVWLEEVARQKARRLQMALLENRR